MTEISQIYSNLSNILLAQCPIDWHHRQSELVINDLFDLKRFDRFLAVGD